MKKNYILLLILLVLSICQVVRSQTNSSYRCQKGYVKKSTGTYVKPHYKTTPNQTNRDNYSTKGNTNNWTGTKGTRAKDYSNEAQNYGKGKTIQTGSKGGQYYYNNKGNKIYVPKRK